MPCYALKSITPPPLTLSNTQRISVQEALKHPFMESLHVESDEPTADFTCDFEFEKEEPQRERIQKLIWDEMNQYHPEVGTWEEKGSRMCADSLAVAGRGRADLSSYRPPMPHHPPSTPIVNPKKEKAAAAADRAFDLDAAAESKSTRDGSGSAGSSSAGSSSTGSSSASSSSSSSRARPPCRVQARHCSTVVHVAAPARAISVI